MEKEFRVVELQAIEKHEIVITVTPLEENLTPEKIIEPQFESEEEKIGFKMGMAMIKGMSQIGGAIVPMAPPGGRAISMLTTIGIKLSADEYVKIGSPGINSIIILEVLIHIKK